MTGVVDRGVWFALSALGHQAPSQLSSPILSVVNSVQNECPRRTRQKPNVFSDLALEVLWCHLDKVSSDSRGRN